MDGARQRVRGEWFPARSGASYTPGRNAPSWCLGGSADAAGRVGNPCGGAVEQLQDLLLGSVAPVVPDGEVADAGGAHPRRGDPVERLAAHRAIALLEGVPEGV